MTEAHWPTKRLQELTVEDRQITYGVVKPGEHDENGVRLVRGGDVANGRIAVSKLRTIKEDVSQQYRRTLLRGGELLVSLVGNPGEAAIAPPEIKGANVARQVGLVALNGSVCHQYVMYFLLSDQGKNELFRQTTGSVQKVINLADLKRVNVPLPDVLTQRKIASILSAYDELIENNSRRIAILEDMAQSIYREWFVHFRYPGHEHVPLVDSPVGKIPEGWETVRTEALLKRLKAGKHYKQDELEPEGTVPVFDQSSAELLGFHNNDPDFAASLSSPVVVFGDHTCKMVLVTTPFSIGPNVVPFVSKTEHPIGFLFWAVRSLVSTREYKRHWTDLNNKEICVPPSGIAAEFMEIVAPGVVTTGILQQKNRILRTTRDLLLPKLISGRLDVEDLDIDMGEPLGELVEATE